MTEQEPDKAPQTDTAISLLRSVLLETAHELRSPLHNILSLCYALKDTPDKGKADTIYQNLKAEIYRAKMTLDNMFSFRSGLEESGRMDRRRVDMATVVAECADMVRVIASQRNIAVAVSGPATHATVHADPQLLRMALLNIIHNAVKYAYSNTRVDIRIEEGSRDIVISVKDEGIGIPHAATEHIFDAFWRGDKDHRRSLPGTGIGLYAAKRILDAHKAHITVKSIPVGAHVSKSPESEEREHHLVTFDVRIPKA